MSGSSEKESVKQQRWRLNVEVNSEMRDLIKSLVVETGSSKTDIIRRALSLLHVVKMAAHKGEYPALITESGEVVSRIVGV
jgi:negative regulator of replication initiation